MMKRWTPLTRAKPIVPDWVKTNAPDLIPYFGEFEVWKNSRYTVDVRRTVMRGDGGEVEMVHLSIRANDRTPTHDWRDFQRIKNEILGPEEEAVEIYPAESRLVDTSNQYHLWCLSGSRAPFGYEQRLVSDTGDPIGAVQRPFEADARPADARWIPMSECIAELRKLAAKKAG